MNPGSVAPKDARGNTIDLHAIEGLLDRIVRAWHPKAIWLFGSRARGDAGASSDWDLLVVVPDDAMCVDDPLVAWRLRKESGAHADLVPCRATDFEDARETPNASHNGVVIYQR